MSDKSSGRGARILRRKRRRDLRRHRGQFLAVLITITLGVMLFGASYDAFRNLTASYERSYERLAFADLWISGGDQEAIAAEVAATPGVQDVERRTQADVPFQVTDTDKLLGRIVGMPPDGQPSVNKVDVIEGDYLDPAEPTGVLVEKHMADHFALTAGDTFDILLADGPTTVTVLGVAVSAEYIVPARSRQDIITTPGDFGVLFVPEDTAARAPPGTVVEQTTVTYVAADDEALTEELRSIALRHDAADVYTQEEQPSNAGLAEDLKGFGELAIAFPALFLLAAGMAAFVLLTRLVQSQKSQIGTLAANGLGRGMILRHYMGFGVILGLSGAVIGLILGVPAGAWVTGAYTSALDIPDTVATFSVVTLVVGILFGLVAGVLAAWAPARAATKIAPAEAMRGLQFSGRAGPSLLERIIPPLRRLPVRTRMSLRGVGRSPRRAVSTGVGVVLAITLVLVSWGMIDTVQLSMSRQFDEVQHNDAQVFTLEPVTPEAVSAVGDVDGVAAAEAVVTLSASLRGADDQYATQLQTFDENTEMHSFLSVDDGERALPDDGVLAGKAVADLLDVGVGDVIRLGLPSLDTTLNAPIRGFVDEPLGTFVYAQTDWLTRALPGADPPVDPAGLARAGSIMAIYDDGADKDAVRAALIEAPGVLAVISTSALKDFFDQFLALFYAFVGMMLLFGGIMAFALIFNTVSVNISERVAEFATMRASGLSSQQISRMLTGENLLLTVVAIPFGLIVGYALAAAFMSSFSSDLFAFDLVVRPSTLVIIAVAMIVVTLLSQIPGLRAVRRIPIAEVVRERSQ